MRATEYHTHYAAIDAGVSGQILGSTGAKGDYLKSLIITLTTSTTTEVSIKDGSGTDIVVLTGALSANIQPIIVSLGIQSVSGPWSVSTGANASVLAIGYFT